MVRGISHCFVCNADLSESCPSESHCESFYHIAEVHKLLRDKRLFHTRVDSWKLDRATLAARDRCLRHLQEALRPAEVHVTGSMGKSTALQGEHDMDVVVVTSSSRDLVVKQLQGAGFGGVRAQRPKDEGRCLIVATFEMWEFVRTSGPECRP